MDQEQEIVYSSKIGSGKIGGVLCQVLKVGNIYIKQNIFPNGNVYEEDMSEKEYQRFLVKVARFESLTK
jgi:hypothetical protein